MVTIEQQLLEKLTPVLKNKGYSIEAINYIKAKGFNKKSKLQVVIANINNEPITLEDCSVVSKEAAVIIDVNDFIAEAYNLEVSSQGCDNILIFFNDFAKSIGKLVELELCSNEGNVFRATITKALNGKISFKKLETTTNNKITVHINNIKSAKLIEKQGAAETL